MHVTLDELKRAVSLMECLNERDGQFVLCQEWPHDDKLILVLNVEHQGIAGELHVRLFDEIEDDSTDSELHAV